MMLFTLATIQGAFLFLNFDLMYFNIWMNKPRPSLSFEGNIMLGFTARIAWACSLFFFFLKNDPSNAIKYGLPP